MKREVKILEQENSQLHKLLELAEYDSTNTGVVQGNVPNPILNGDGGRGKYDWKYLFAKWFQIDTHKLLLKSFLSLINGLGSSSSMGSYFRGENLSDFELDELNSGNDSGNDNNGKQFHKG